MLHLSDMSEEGGEDQGAGLAVGAEHRELAHRLQEAPAHVRREHLINPNLNTQYILRPWPNVA